MSKHTNEQTQSKKPEQTPEQSRFEALSGEFVAQLEDVRNLSAHSVRAYRHDLDDFMSWCRRSKVNPFELTHRQLRSYLADLRQAAYSTKTINRRLSALRGIYAWLDKKGEATSAAALATSGPKISRQLPTTLSDAEYRKLIDTCSGSTATDVRDRALLEFLYATGARISEVSRLNLTDVDYRQGQVRLFGKGSKERIVPIYDVALKALKDYVTHARPELVAGADKSQAALFVSTRANRMSPDALRKRFEFWVRMAGMSPAITPHAARHSYATELLSGGADLRSVQELLGHESLSTTQIYTHLSVERLKEATRLAHPRG
ncbi:MAG: tyrosine recombinase XerC [Atopobiaceae bacterium]|nr:tyrosine recombinase XerC [Atopobiaceae bacterium]